jgi:hypothetical protein
MWWTWSLVNQTHPASIEHRIVIALDFLWLLVGAALNVYVFLHIRVFKPHEFRLCGSASDVTSTALAYPSNWVLFHRLEFPTHSFGTYAC